jgi:phosphinothricin acetyltransferase
MKIRDAMEADLPAIVDIYNATVPTRMVTAELEPVSVESRVPWFYQHSPQRYPLWVVEMDKDQIAGWLSFKEFIPRSAYRATSEISVYVDERFRRRGIAHRFLEEAIERSPELELSALVGLIFANNEPSLQLFEQLGFERWGLLPRVARLDGLERDVAIVGRHISAQPND